jgi:hypothetical protein
MKKLILSLACCCALSLATFTPVASYAHSSSQHDPKMMDKDGTVKMVNGKMMIMTKDSWKPMASARTMSNGTKVMTNGMVMMKNGKKEMLKDGDIVKPDGAIKKKM